MYGRIAALLGAIVLFATIWSSPEPARRAPVSAPQAMNPAPAMPTEAAIPFEPEIPNTPSKAEVPLDEPSRLPKKDVALETTAEWVGEVLLVQLPDGLAPGVYRVISRHGAVGQVRVRGPAIEFPPSGGDLREPPATAGTTSAVFTWPAGDTIWYFVPQVPGEVATADRPPVRSASQTTVSEIVPVDEPAMDLGATSLEEELPTIELSSKDQVLVEALVRQWLHDLANSCRSWFQTRLLFQRTKAGGTPRFLRYVSQQRSAADPDGVEPPRRSLPMLTVGYECPAEPSCACP